MKRNILLPLLFCVFLGCSPQNRHIDHILDFRQRLLNSEGCAFDADITADYGDELYRFKLNCEFDKSGDMTFRVLEPQSISGITGVVDQAGGKLTFDDQALAFSVLAEGQISPVCAPWHVIRALRSGYLDAATQWDDGFQLLIDDSYQDDALHLDIKMNSQDQPVYAEILWQSRRVLSVSVNNFTFL